MMLVLWFIYYAKSFSKSYTPFTVLASLDSTYMYPERRKKGKEGKKKTAKKRKKNQRVHNKTGLRVTG